MKWISIKKCSDSYGISEEAIRALKKKGYWREQTHWVKAPNGRIFINVKGVDQWIESQTA